MEISVKEKVLIGREVIRQELKRKYGDIFEENELKNLLDYRNRYTLRRKLIYENDLYEFIHYGNILLETEEYINRTTETEDTKIALNNLFGKNLIIPEKYKGIIEKYRKDILEEIKFEIRFYRKNINNSNYLSIPGDKILKILKNKLSSKSFTETPEGYIKNIHTNEIIVFNNDSSIIDLILGFQKIAREEKIDELFSEEKIKTELGIDSIVYEVSELEPLRQSVLNQIRQQDLPYNKIPNKLPKELEEEIYIRMRKKISEYSTKIEEYNNQIKVGNENEEIFPYRTTIYQRQGWNKRYK